MKRIVLPFGTSPDQNLSRYLKEIRKFPMLEIDEEFHLAKRWRDFEDTNAASDLINSHLRLVVKIANGFLGYGLPITDLISEGNVGIMQALRRFDPERGYRFSTYARWWIRASIQEYILHSWSMVKIGTTAAQKKLFFNLRRLKQQINSTEEGDLNPENVAIIADKLSVPEVEVINMNRRLTKADKSLNNPLHQDRDGEELDNLKVVKKDQEMVLLEKTELTSRRNLLNTALEDLTGRELHIFSERRLNEEPATLQVLSNQYGISRERIRQIEVRAFEKVRKTIKNAIV